LPGKSGGGFLNVGGKIRKFLYLADFDDLAAGCRAALRPADRLLPRRHVDHPVAAEHFLGLGEGTVGHDRLAAGERYPRAH